MSSTGTLMSLFHPYQLPAGFQLSTLFGFDDQQLRRCIDEDSREISEHMIELTQRLPGVLPTVSKQTMWTLHATTVPFSVDVRW